MSGQQDEIENARDDLKYRQEYASDYHAPVLCKAVVTGLITDPAGIYVDATVGGGGHAEALLAELSSEGRLIGLDRDADALEVVRNRLAKDITGGRLDLVRANFASLRHVLQERGLEAIDGLLLDLGVSSHQLDEATRGFSHRQDGPLDMRMDSRTVVSAATILNEWPEQEISLLLKRFGEEPRARRIARAIVEKRPIATTGELSDAVRSVVSPHQAGKTLSRVFQAVRIAVNGELDALERALVDAVDLLREGGRIAVISYHSLEDRRVKRFLRSGNFEGTVHRDLYGSNLSPLAEVVRGAAMPTEEEIAVNPRARSARLRIAERVSTVDVNNG